MLDSTYILDGKKPVAVSDMKTWGKWFQKANRTVALTIISDSKISTVFLGLDHAFGGGPPLLFETLVFGGKLDGEMDRCSTWEEAEKMHLDMCNRVREA